MALLKINDKCEVIDLDTGIIYGNLSKRTDGTIYFRGNELVKQPWTEEMGNQLMKILKEINND